MSSEDRADPQLSSEDRRFVERLDAAYRPPPLSAARRAALDARVRERVGRPDRGFGVVAGLVFASLIAALVWVGVPGTGPTPESAPERVAGADLPVAEAWEHRLFLGSLSEETLGEDEPGMELPPEYAAIELAFFDG